MTTPGRLDEGGSQSSSCHGLCPQEQQKPQADLVLRVVLGCDPSSSNRRSVLHPFRTVCSEGHAAALRTIRHLRLDRAAKLGVPPERQLAVLSAADHATAATIHTSQVEGLVACLVQQLEQQQQQQEEEERGEEEEEEEGGRQQGLEEYSEEHHAPVCQTLCSSSTTTANSATTGNSSSAAGAPAPRALTMAAAKPRGPWFRKLTVTGPVTAATIQHLEQLLDLLPGTQHLEKVLLAGQVDRNVSKVYKWSLCTVLPAVTSWGSSSRGGAAADTHQPLTMTSTTPSNDSSGGSSSRAPAPSVSSRSWRSSCHTLSVALPKQRSGDPAAIRVDPQLQPLLGALQQPQTLFLGGALAKQLPGCTSSLSTLRMLHLVDAGRYGPNLLACVAQLTNLRHLGLSGGAPLTTWPAAFSDLVHLSSLHLRGRVLTREALEGVCGMTRLQRLDLIGSSGITSLPTIISRLVRLDWLALEGCPVRRLPQTMTALTGLRMLSWCSDREATAPLQLRVVWRLRNLCALKIADNHLAALPGAISRLGYLQSLHVHGRAVKAVPGTLSALVRLKTLYVARRLRSLPEGITALTRLREVTTPGVVLHKQLPAVRAFLAGRQAQGCRLELAPSDSNSE